MLDVRVCTWFELIGNDSSTCNRLERQGPNKVTGGFRHDGYHLVPTLLQPPCYVDRLVSADTPRDAESYKGHDILIQIQSAGRPVTGRSRLCP